MKCGTCGYAYVEKTTTHIEEWIGDELIVIQGVPVEKCPQCGEEYFAPATLRRLESIMAERAENPRREPLTIMQVPVFGFALAS